MNSWRSEIYATTGNTRWPLKCPKKLFACSCLFAFLWVNKKLGLFLFIFARSPLNKPRSWNIFSSKFSSNWILFANTLLKLFDFAIQYENLLTQLQISSAVETTWNGMSKNVYQLALHIHLHELYCTYTSIQHFCYSM